MVAVKEGGNLDLSCPVVVNNEDVIISWTCDNEPANIRSSRIHVTDSGKLRIRGAQVGDSCNYRCEAADGVSALSVIIKVVIVDRRVNDYIAAFNRSHAASGEGRGRQAFHYQPSPWLGETRKQQQVAAESTLNETRELEIQVEPTHVEVDKNATFYLECKVKHPMEMMKPQIVWLKEFIGAKPESASEAYEKNLVNIDDTYYHGLNWPRSQTYWSKSATANSAILIPHSNFAHSGRYICFAGYPKTLIAASTSLSFNQAAAASRSSKYKMALATVRVNDPEGFKSHQDAIRLASKGAEEQSASSNLLVAIIAENSWPRNVALSILMICLILCFAKLVYLKLSTSLLDKSGDANQDQVGDANLSSQTSRNMAVKQILSESIDLEDSTSFQKSCTANQTCKNLSDVCIYFDKPAQTSERYLADNHHVYCEIDDATKLALTPNSLSDDIYKSPVKQVE